MKTLTLTGSLGALCLALAACTVNNNNNAAAVDENLSAAGENVTLPADEGAGATADATAAAGTKTTTVFVPGARIVEENGVTYRIDPDGARVRLGSSDSRIVIENGTRYRVDPDGNRVRIDDRGLVIGVAPSGVTARVPIGNNSAVVVNSN